MKIQTYPNYIWSSLFLLLLIGACKPKNDDALIVEPTLSMNDCASPILQKSHLIFGNPSGATDNINDKNNYLIELPQYHLSYNNERGTPNWVAWHLSNEWLGNIPRQNDFRDYAELPLEFFIAQEYDYSGSGFNRGHCCPSGDRKCSEEFNSNTFYMINIIPQAPNHNQIPWRILEEYCRTLVDEGKELYIIMGNYGKGGIGENGYATSIADGYITVPASIWKIIIVLDKGTDDLDRIDTNTRIITVDIANTQLASDSHWGNYRLSIDDLEERIGYDFLSNLDTHLQENIESEVDDGPVE